MRKSFDGLMAIIRDTYQLDPYANAVYLFCGRDSRKIKALYFDKTGFVLMQKRLDGTVSALTNTASGIKVSWNKVAGAAGYYVYRKAGSGYYVKIKTITRGTTVTFEDKSKLANGTTYTYAVKAFNGKVISAYTTLAVIRLTRPAISSCKNTSKGAVTVKWKKNTKANEYQVKYVLGKKTKTFTIKKNSTVSYVLKKLTKGKTYKVYVRSYRTSGGKTYYSEWSVAKSVKIKK